MVTSIRHMYFPNLRDWEMYGIQMESDDFQVLDQTTAQNQFWIFNDTMVTTRWQSVGSNEPKVHLTSSNLTKKSTRLVAFLCHCSSFLSLLLYDEGSYVQQSVKIGLHIK